MTRRYRDRAIIRMAERGISEQQVSEVIEKNDVIESTPDAFPFPKRLVFGSVGGRPIHVSVATDGENQTEYVITVYEPDPKLWTSDFRTRREKP